MTNEVKNPPRSAQEVIDRILEDEKEVCDAIAETEATVDKFPHSQAFVCELEPNHEGPHRSTFEWEGGEWTKLVDEDEE